MNDFDPIPYALTGEAILQLAIEAARAESSRRIQKTSSHAAEASVKR